MSEKIVTAVGSLPLLTPDQEKAEVAIREQGAISRRFLIRHPEFVPSDAAAKKMADWLKANTDGKWCEANLDKAYEALISKSELELDVYTPPVVPPPVPPAPVEELKPWGVLKTKQDVEALLETPQKREQYKKWLAHPEFVRSVNRILQGESL